MYNFIKTYLRMSIKMTLQKENTISPEGKYTDLPLLRLKIRKRRHRCLQESSQKIIIKLLHS